MSTLQVTTITTVNNTTPLILSTGNTGGGQIVLNSANSDVQFVGNMKFSNTSLTGDLSFTGNVAVGANVTNFSSTGKNAKFAIDSGGLNLDDGYFMAWGGGTGRTSITGNKNNGTLVLAAAANNSGYMTFATNTAERMRITSDGNVGIGTTAPSSLLHINSTASIVRPIVTATTGFVDWQVASTGGNLYLGIDNSAGAVSGTAYGRHIFSDGAYPIDLFTNSINRMRITSDGRVGIGTNNPGFLLDVSGKGRIGNSVAQGNPSSSDITANAHTILSGTGGNYLAIGQYDGGSSYAQWIQSSYQAPSTAMYNLVLQPLGGSLVVGTNAPWGAVKTTLFSSGTCVGAQCSGASGTPAILIGKNSNDATTAQILMQFLYNGYSLGLGQINGNGGSQAAFGSYSDIRLKENVENLPSQLDKICSLRPVEFDYIEGTGYAGHQIGFVAQEMQEVYPDTVAEGSDGMLMITGWNKTEARLVKAIQELRAEFDAYKASHP